jgi:SatD family protein
MDSQLHAVIIADVMSSSKQANLRSLLGSKLADISRRHLRRKLIKLPYSITAGDEFQSIACKLDAVPSILLDLRIALRPLSLRIGVGLGQVNGRIQPPVNRLGGEAFQSARHAIESVKAGFLFRFEVLTAVQSPNGQFDETMNLIYGLHDTLVLKITDKQWKNLEEAAKWPSFEQSAKKLKVDASTVSRNLKRGYYWQLKETAKVAESLIARTFK